MPRERWLYTDRGIVREGKQHVRFKQIVPTTFNDHERLLFALDEEGRVWAYGYKNDDHKHPREWFLLPEPTC